MVAHHHNNLMNRISYCILCFLLALFGNSPVNGAVCYLPRSGLIELRLRDDGPDAKFAGCWCKIERGGIVVDCCLCLLRNHTFFLTINAKRHLQGSWVIVPLEGDQITIVLLRQGATLETLDTSDVNHFEKDVKGILFYNRSNHHLHSLTNKDLEFRKTPIKAD